MSGANIVHSGYGLRCEKTRQTSESWLGLDNSARCCTGPGSCQQDGCATRWIRYLSPHHNFQQWFFPGSEWCEEPQALTLFGQVQSDIIHRSAFWQLPLWLSSPANRASGEMVLMQSVRFISRSAPVRRVKFIVVTIHAFAGC